MCDNTIRISIDGGELITIALTGADTVDKVNARLQEAGVDSYVHACTPEEAQEMDQKRRGYQAESRIGMIAEMRAWKPAYPNDVTLEESAMQLGMDYTTLDQWPFEDVYSLYSWAFEPVDD